MDTKNQLKYDAVSILTCKTNCEFYGTCLGNTEACIKEIFPSVLATLTPRETDIIKSYYEFDSTNPTHNNEPMDFDEDGEFYFWKDKVETLSKKYCVTEERIKQIIQKALRKLRHPSRGKKLSAMCYEAFEQSPICSYSKLLNDILGNTNDTIKLGNYLGLDFSIIDKTVCAKKSAEEIKEELSQSPLYFPELSAYIVSLESAGISTLNALLRTPQKHLLYSVFDGDDILYFNLRKTLFKMGYILKSENVDALHKHLYSSFMDSVFNNFIYEQKLCELPLEITQALLTQKIYTFNDLLNGINELELSDLENFTATETKEILNSILDNYNLIYHLDEETNVYLTKTNVETFFNHFTIWAHNNNVSLISLESKLLKEQLFFADAINYIIENFIGFRYGENVCLDRCYDMTIEELDLSIKTFSALRKLQIKTIRDVMGYTLTDLKEKLGLERNILNELESKLLELGLTLKNPNISKLFEGHEEDK